MHIATLTSRTHPGCLLRTHHTAALALALACLVPAVEAQTPPQPLVPDTVGIYAKSSNYFRLTDSAAVRRFHFGKSNLAFRDQIPVAGDWDNDGWDTVAIYQKQLATFEYSNRNSYSSATVTVQLPLPPTVTNSYPVAGDWNGDGQETFGAYDITTRTFYLSNVMPPSTPEQVFSLDLPSGIPQLFTLRPVAGDFDGDGKDSVGLYHAGLAKFWLANSTTPPQPPAAQEVAVDEEFTFGPPAANPDDVVATCGDWDADGVDTAGVLEVGTETFHMRYQPGPTQTLSVHTRTNSQWAAVAGVWDLRGPLGESNGYDWGQLVDPAEAGFDPIKLANGFTAMRQLDFANSLLVLRDAQLVGEEYFATRGYDPSMAVNIKSVSKSFLGCLTGVAWDDGTLGLMDKVGSHLNTYFSPESELAAITIDDIMTMRSALDWDTENLSSMLAGMYASNDWAGYIFGRGLNGTVGATFRYGINNTYLGSAILSKLSDNNPTQSRYENYVEWAKTNFLDPLGIRVVRWDRDPQGVPYTGQIMMRPRDMARIGHMVSSWGTVDETTQVLSAQWVDWMLQRLVFQTYQGDDYCRWWRSRVLNGVRTYYGLGHGGQLILWAPAVDMHLVVTADWEVDSTVGDSQIQAIWPIIANHLIPAAIGD